MITQLCPPYSFWLWYIAGVEREIWSKYSHKTGKESSWVLVSGTLVQLRHAAVLGRGHVTTGVSCHTLQWNEFYYITKHVRCRRMIFSPGCCDEMLCPDSSQQRGSWQWQWGQKEAAAGTRMGASHRHTVTLSRGAAAGLCVNTKLLNNIFNISMPIWRSARGRVFN